MDLHVLSPPTPTWEVVSGMSCLYKCMDVRLPSARTVGWNLLILTFHIREFIHRSQCLVPV